MQRKFIIEKEKYTLKIYDSAFTKDHVVFKITNVVDGAQNSIVLDPDQVLQVYQALENFLIPEHSISSPAPALIEPDEDGVLSVNGIKFEFGE